MTSFNTFFFDWYTTPMSGKKVEKVVTLSELQGVAESVLADVRSGARNGAAVLALSGELGAGKTTFTQILATVLGVEAPITSPTFVIQKNYKTRDADFKTLVHIDAYRIDDPNELLVLNFEEVLKDVETLVVIEWAERVAPLLPKDVGSVRFEHVDETTRNVSYSIPHG